MNRLLKIISLIAFALMVAQCSPRTVKTENIFDTIHDEYAAVQPADFYKEIERLNGSLTKSQNPSVDAKTHIQLAFLYSHYRNPLPDYKKALDHLRIYELLDPEGSRQVYVRNWVGMLREIVNLSTANKDLREKTERLNSANQELKEKTDQVKREIAEREKENSDLNEKFEKLKSLDIEIEQKRKMVK